MHSYCTRPTNVTTIISRALALGRILVGPMVCRGLNDDTSEIIRQGSFNGATPHGWLFIIIWACRGLFIREYRTNGHKRISNRSCKIHISGCTDRAYKYNAVQDDSDAGETTRPAKGLRRPSLCLRHRCAPLRDVSHRPTYMPTR